jgi:adenylate kinase
MDLVLFGIQGSGKGTQAKKLAADHNYQIFEAGGELRRIAASGSELGRTVSSYIDHGHLVPFEIIMQVVHDAIAHVPKDQKLLFDGIPRDVDQMREFNKIMDELGRPFTCVQLTVNEEQALKRIQGRALEQGRADDANEEFIRRRMGIFKEKTKPVIDAYRTSGNVVDVDGEGTMDEVYARIEQALV